MLHVPHLLGSCAVGIVICGLSLLSKQSIWTFTPWKFKAFCAELRWSWRKGPQAGKLWLPHLLTVFFYVSLCFWFRLLGLLSEKRLRVKLPGGGKPGNDAESTCCDLKVDICKCTVKNVSTNQNAFNFLQHRFPRLLSPERALRAYTPGSWCWQSEALAPGQVSRLR